jgi:hypothetical protein
MVLPGFTFESVEELPAVEIPEDSRQYRALHNIHVPLSVNGEWGAPEMKAAAYVFGFEGDFWRSLQVGLEVEVTGELDWNTVTELQRRSLIAPDGEWNKVTIRGIQAALNSGILF